MNDTKHRLKWSNAMKKLILLFVACFVAVSAQADEVQHLDGSWAITITAVEPPGLPPFKGLITFTLNGEVLESRRPYVPFTPFGPVLESSGHGAWVRTGRREFAVAFQFLVQAAPNNPTFVNGEELGTDNIRMQLVRDRSGESLAGTFVSEAKDADGNVVFTAHGTITGTRMRAEPQPQELAID
jgi:hypothetical protein